MTSVKTFVAHSEKGISLCPILAFLNIDRHLWLSSEYGQTVISTWVPPDSLMFHLHNQQVSINIWERIPSHRCFFPWQTCWPTEHHVQNICPTQ